ncbi:MAG: hypothetical protein V1750_11255, partial [Acidobacteriota bacterium]
MTRYGNGRAALEDDAVTAEALGWPRRRRSLPEPEIVLCPRFGDPRREPWIAPPGWGPAAGVRGLVPRRASGMPWTFIADVPGVLPYLARLGEAPQTGGARVALFGLGRVGGVAATVLASMAVRRSGIRELLVYDADPANLERWLIELRSIAEWRGRECLPVVRGTTPDEAFRECGAFLFAATAGVPPLGAAGDVRMVQYAPNRKILKGLLAQARAAAYTGLFLVVSDPVDWLALAAFHDSNTDRRGAFTGAGLAPERIAGLGLGVMWARALAAARREGWEEVARRGAVFGPHGLDVLAFDDLRRPEPGRSETLGAAARGDNFLVRKLGFLPFVGPGASSVALTLPALLAGREMLASV